MVDDGGVVGAWGGEENKVLSNATKAIWFRF